MWSPDTCRPFNGKPSGYQATSALLLFSRRGMTVQPWHWISTTCDQEMCMNSDHLVATAPQHLSYPSGVCVYCGGSGWTRDHLLPMTSTGPAARRYVLTVPACGSCNSAIGDRGTASITHRRLIAHASIRKRAAAKLRTKDWTKAELDELGPTLRSHVIAAVAKKREVLARLSWPTDPAYDLRALEHSGIEDPCATGLLGLPWGATVEGAA